MQGPAVPRLPFPIASPAWCPGDASERMEPREPNGAAVTSGRPFSAGLEELRIRTVSSVPAPKCRGAV